MRTAVALALALVGWARSNTGARPGVGSATAARTRGRGARLPQRRHRANAVNWWRVRAGLRSLAGPASRLVLSGGPTSGGRPEAELMAYLWRLRLDLAARLVRGWDYRLGEWILAKPALAVLGRRSLRRLG